MPPRGHKPDCNCIVCRRLRAKLVPEPVVAEPTQLRFVGQQVITTRHVKAQGIIIPSGAHASISGFAFGRYKIEYRKHFVWVEPSDIE